MCSPGTRSRGVADYPVMVVTEGESGHALATPFPNLSGFSRSEAAIQRGAVSGQ